MKDGDGSRNFVAVDSGTPLIASSQYIYRSPFDYGVRGGLSKGEPSPETKPSHHRFTPPLRIRKIQRRPARVRWAAGPTAAPAVVRILGHCDRTSGSEPLRSGKCPMGAAFNSHSTFSDALPSQRGVNGNFSVDFSRFYGRY